MTERPIARQCLTCAHSQPDPLSDPVAEFHECKFWCRINPPSFSGWPIVTTLDWCSRWEPDPEQIEADHAI